MTIVKEVLGIQLAVAFDRRKGEPEVMVAQVAQEGLMKYGKKWIWLWVRSDEGGRVGLEGGV